MFMALGAGAIPMRLIGAPIKTDSSDYSPLCHGDIDVVFD